MCLPAVAIATGDRSMTTVTARSLMPTQYDHDGGRSLARGVRPRAYRVREQSRRLHRSPRWLREMSGAAHLRGEHSVPFRQGDA